METNRCFRRSDNKFLNLLAPGFLPNHIWPNSYPDYVNEPQFKLAFNITPHYQLPVPLSAVFSIYIKEKSSTVEKGDKFV